MVDAEIFTWSAFGTIIIILLILDLGFFNKKDEAMGFTKTLWLSGFYISIGLLFGIFILYEFGTIAASEYYTGFLLEKAMSLDNIFVISIIFTFFQIPPKYQHRVLFWGILGVIILRGVMIYAGVIIIEKFSWILFIFAGLLIFTGIKTLYLIKRKSFEVKNLLIYRFLEKYVNLYPKLAGHDFTIRIKGKLYFTPLFVSLVTIEFMDLIFAFDSIPAIFAITQNSFIIYTSNIFAILGLRALFFCLSNIVERFEYVKYTLAIILILIGIKIFIGHFIDIPKMMILILTITLILASIILSILKK